MVTGPSGSEFLEVDDFFLGLAVVQPVLDPDDQVLPDEEVQIKLVVLRNLGDLAQTSQLLETDSPAGSVVGDPQGVEDLPTDG